MARNGSGTYTTVNTFVAGDTITALSHNQNMADIAAELTNSVAADGQTTMTGPLKASSGTVALPGVAFGSDPDTGIYRIGSNNLGIAANGAKVVDVATTGLTVVGALEVSGAITSAGGESPGIIGEVKIYAGLTAPTGWLLCYGQAISRTTYAALFAIISTTYGVGDGSTTFNVPDIRGRVVAGQDDMGGSSANRLTNANDGLDGDTLGATGGGETQTLATANLPAYTPAGTIVSTPSLGVAIPVRTYATSGSNVSTQASNASNVGSDNGTLGVAVTGTIESLLTGTAQGGTSTAFGVVQPTIILNYIIKT